MLSLLVFAEIDRVPYRHERRSCWPGVSCSQTNRSHSGQILAPAGISRVVADAPRPVRHKFEDGTGTAGQGVADMTELVRYEAGSEVATVTLDSPHNRNALSAQLVAELPARRGEAGADGGVRAIVLPHTGRVFGRGPARPAAAPGSLGGSG